MTKKTFLKKLETSLSPLGEEKTSEIIKIYGKIIDEEVKNGKEEKDIIDSLGDINLISKLYLDNNDEEKEAKDETKNNKDDKDNSKEEAKSTVDVAIDGVLNFVDDAFKNIDTDLAKRILIILCFIFIGFIAVSLINIPFRIIDFIGRNIFGHLFNNFYFYEIVRSLWSLGIGLCFIVFIVWLIIRYTQRITAHYSSNNKNESKKESVNEEKVEKVEKENSNMETADSVLDILFIVLKVFIVILTIPLIMMEVGFTVALIVLILLIINGVMLFGPAIIMLGLIILVFTVIDLIYSALFKGGIK